MSRHKTRNTFYRITREETQSGNEIYRGYIIYVIYHSPKISNCFKKDLTWRLVPGPFKFSKNPLQKGI